MQELGNCKQVTLCHEWGSADVGILEDKTGFRISGFFLFVFGRGLPLKAPDLIWGL